jgi:sterol desaturase/sphingolipid hydroxylase (fatty acid hydroxylase superfamily)
VYHTIISPRAFSTVLEVSADSAAIAFCVSKTTVSEWRSSSSWFRTQAFQACDPGFKSRRPHQLTSIPWRIKNFMVKVQLAIAGIYALAALLIFASVYNWHWWILWGNYIHLFWVILSSVLAAVAIFQASILLLQLVDKWYFMHKAEESSHQR